MHHKVAMSLGVTTTVLGGPLNRQLRANIIGHGGSNAVATLGIILRVEETITIVSVSILFIQAVIGAARVGHVTITVNIGDKNNEKLD